MKTNPPTFAGKLKKRGAYVSTHCIKFQTIYEVLIMKDKKQNPTASDALSDMQQQIRNPISSAIQDFGMPQQSSSATSETLIQGFDLQTIRLKQNYGENFATQKRVMRVPVTKPKKGNFFMVRTGDEWQIPVTIIEGDDNNESHLVLDHVAAEVPEFCRQVTLFTAIDRRNNIFLIPIPHPGPDGQRNSWHESLLRCLVEAQTRWVRVSSNREINAYDLHSAKGDLNAPEWPVMSFSAILNTAFQNKLIDSVEHPLIQKLWGAS
jgi:hypothetical protein